MAGMSSSPQRNRTSSRLAAIAESATLAVDAKAKALKAAGPLLIDEDLVKKGVEVDKVVDALVDPSFAKAVIK